MSKEEIVVSAEVKTYLKDLYHQIEYELREDYEDSLEKTTQALLDIKEYIEKNSYFESNIVKTMVLGDYSSGILDIVNKALGDKENE